MNLTVQIDHIEALNLAPDDILVVTVPAMTAGDQIAAVKEKFSSMFPNHQVLVKPGSMSLDIFRDGNLVA